jgi:acyl-CoA thioesterase
VTPDELAHASAAAMWSADTGSRGLGMEIVEVAPGRATLTMTVSEAMLNGHEIAHGGFIFTLADSAFAFACNSYGERTVAAHCSISFVKSAAKGDRLVAAAREVSRTGRSGIYDVSVTVGDTVIAEFRGHSRTIGGSIV